MQITRRQLISGQASPNTDRVIGSVPIPGEGRFEQLWSDVSVIASARQATNKATMYGISGYLVEVDDLDTTDTLEDLWDRMIPKPLVMASDIYDIGTVASGGTGSLTGDTANLYEPGQVDIVALVDNDADSIREWYRREKMVTFSEAPLAFETDETYSPTDRFKIRVTGGLNVRRPSYMLLGLSSPNLDGTATDGDLNTLTETEWAMLKYLETFLDDAWKHLIGVAGASGTPYSTIAVFTDRLIAPNPVWEYTNAFQEVTWQYHVKSTWQIDVPGTPNFTSISSR